MARKTSILTIVIDAAIFIGLEVAALSMLSHSGELQNIWIARSLHGVNAKLWGSKENIGRYFHLKSENEELSLENYLLLQELRKYRSDEEESEFGYLETIKNFSYIRGSVVKHSINKQHNYIIVDRGADDGILRGSGVITPNGVVGIVKAVSRHYAYVMSFENTDMVVSARVGKQGAVGPLSWDGITKTGAVLKEIPHNTPFEDEDTVYTSGFSALFPADIPLGTVKDSKIVNGAAYEIKVSLFEDLSRVRYVTVVNNIDREEITELEENAE